MEKLLDDSIIHQEIERVTDLIKRMGGDIKHKTDDHVALFPATNHTATGHPEQSPFNEESKKITKLGSRETKSENTIVQVGDIAVGGEQLTIIAGSCAVETVEGTNEGGRLLQMLGADLMRGGAFKPRTSPYSFQGLGKRGLEILADARKLIGIPVVSEALDPENFDLVEQYVDLVQIGARNMQNFSLLKRAGKSTKPILLKRGISATISEYLMAVEYIMAGGNHNVILCERGIRTFNEYTRFTLDISSIPELKLQSHLPIIVDPSHASGRRDMIVPLSKAAIAAGADGIMVEVHPFPDKALSDGYQSITFKHFARLMKELRALAPAVGRKL